MHRLITLALAIVATATFAVRPSVAQEGYPTKPITMWDSTTLKVIKSIEVGGRPDGIMFDPYNERVWVLSQVL